MAKLIVRYPDNKIKEIDFDKPLFKIGRATDNDLVLDNEEIDEHQAVIESANEVFTLVDTSENKSTRVNGKQVDRVNITYGDRISLGPIVILFYPSKKTGGISDRLKIILYISAGAVIIIASMILIFLLITPKISSSVAKSIGGTYLETQGKKVLIEGKKQVKEKGKIKQGIQKEKEEAIKSVSSEQLTSVEVGKKSIFQKFSSIFKRKIKVSLPEPTEKEIRNRKAIAIPHGIGRLFFRRVPVYVKVHETSIPETSIEEQKKGEIQKEIQRWKEKKTGVKEKVAQKGEAVVANEGEHGIGQIPAKQSEAVSKKGFIPLITSPFKKVYNFIFRKRKGEVETGAGQVTKETTALPEGGKAQAPKPTRVKKEPEKVAARAPVKLNKIPEQTLKSIVNPLEEINKIELAQVKSRLPEETPVYSKDELRKISGKNLFKDIVLSDRENVGVDIIWKFPSSIDVEPAGKVIYAGTSGFINDDKIPDFIFTTKKGSLISLNGKNGEEILNLDLNSQIYSPIITGKKGKNINILTVYKNGKIEVYKRTLEKNWFAVEDHPITAMPVLTDINRDKIDDIVFPTLGMEIIAIDGRSGFELWRFTDLSGDVDTSPVCMDVNEDSVQDIIVSSIDGYVNVIDGKTGWGLWKRKIYGRPAGPPLIVDLDGDGKKEIVSLTRNGILTDYSNEGKNLFTISLGKRFIIPPSAGDIDNNGSMDLVFMSSDGIVQAIEGKTRRSLWKYETEGKTSFGRIALADLNMDKSLDIAFSTPSGLVYVLDGNTGTPLAIFNTGDFVLATPSIFDFNRDKIPEIIIPTYNGSVYCVRIADVKKPLFYMRESYWPSENHDNRNSGVSEIKSKLTIWK